MFFERWIQDAIEPVQSRIRHNSRVLALCLIVAFLFGNTSFFFLPQETRVSLSFNEFTKPKLVVAVLAFEATFFGCAAFLVIDFLVVFSFEVDALVALVFGAILALVILCTLFLFLEQSNRSLLYHFD